MTHCTVTSSRNSRAIGLTFGLALFACLGSLTFGLIPTIETAQALVAYIRGIL